MLSQKLEKAINEQVNKEMYSAYLYMAMSAHASARGLKGIARWFMVQYHEEMVHAMKLYEYLQDQGNDVILRAIEKPEGSFTSALSLYEAALKHERFVTKSINELVDLAIAEKDHASWLIFCNNIRPIGVSFQTSPSLVISPRIFELLSSISM